MGIDTQGEAGVAALNMLALARMADDVYAPGNSTLLLGDWILQDMIEDKNFRARAYKHARRRVAVVVFRGTANWRDAVVADAGAIGLSLNALALKMNSAIDFTTKIKTLYPAMWMTGHSLGGAYVQLMSAICDVPGTTFNAPGVTGLINQMSSNPLVRLAGSVGGGAMSLLTLKASDLLNMAAASFEDAAFQPVANYRGHLDPVSLIGVHVGQRVKSIRVANQSPHPHSMQPIIRSLEEASGGGGGGSF